MSHEPECPVVTFWLPVFAECRCDILRPAYQRGREDAAQAIIRQIGGTQDNGNIAMVAIPQPGWHQIDIVEACIAAARGRGERS